MLVSFKLLETDCRLEIADCDDGAENAIFETGTDRALTDYGVQQARGTGQNAIY
ncbi:hypothetical protein [Polaromonas sp. YR568]|uniref:hypothetical protein n=1 Tax=Polaromonas sp. YR568 TaxID=1855301 RepID=UPI00313778F8